MSWLTALSRTAGDLQKPFRIAYSLDVIHAPYLSDAYLVAFGFIFSANQPCDVMILFNKSLRMLILLGNSFSY
jgi:hypothetical protein